MSTDPAPSTLNLADLEMFRKIGVLPELLAAAGVSRVTNAEARDLYGFNSSGDNSGIVFPYRDPITGHRVSARLRRDNPEIDEKGKPKKKYVYPYGDNHHLFFPPWAGTLLDAVAVPVGIGESEKFALALKALAERKQQPFVPIALGGVWGWRGKTGTDAKANGEREQARGPLPDLYLIAWEGRKVYIIFDGNVYSNSQVNAAREALARDLSGRGAHVFLVDIPQEPGVNGPDDFIAARGDDAFLQILNAAKEWRPTITVVAGEAPRAVDEAEEILIANAERLRVFQRSTEVVRAITLTEKRLSHGLRRDPGAVLLAPVNQNALTETLDRLITRQKFHRVKEKTEIVRIDCPGRIAMAYLSRMGLWRLPVLTGVISAPIMRPDGTVICRRGYDEETGLYLTEDWPDLNGKPTLKDAREALTVLRRPFAEFPFVAAESESVHLAAMLTALQRRLLESAPLIGYDAPGQRNGKSLLAESVAILATGMPAPAMALSTNREEIRKAVHAALREGHTIVNLDNIDGPLGSPYLSMAITQPEYSDRLLGETKTLRLPTNLTWTATGNNLAFRGDLAVRAIVCRIDAKVERPEERKFEIPELKHYLIEHRRELVVAALTILRAYMVAGRPEQNLTPWGGFNEWSATIRAPLLWLSLKDPCLTRRNVIEDDPERTQSVALLFAWHAAVGDKPVQIARVIEAAGDRTDLHDALIAVAAKNNDTAKIDALRVSHWCRKNRDRVLRGLMLTKGEDHSDRATWRVSRMADHPQPPGREAFLSAESTRSTRSEGDFTTGKTDRTGKNGSPKSEHAATNETEQFSQSEVNPTNPTNPTEGDSAEPQGLFPAVQGARI
jgi:hypothetical protein